MNGYDLSNFLALDSCPQMTPQHYLFSIVQVRTLSQAVYIAAEYGIANHVSRDKPIHINQLAKLLGFNETNLRRLMAYLSSHNIFKELEHGYFVGTDLSQFLRDDVPGNMRDFICFQNCKPINLAMLDMDYSLKTGETSFSKTHGTSFYSFLSENLEIGKRFDNAMTCFNGPLQATVASIYDFGRYETIVEMAGGQGGFLKQILLRHPNVKKATLIEREAVLDGVLPELMTDPKLKGRFQAVAGDFLTSVDYTGDLFVIAQTLHNFSDSDVLKIIGNVAKAMAQKPGSRLLIVEPNNGEFTPNKPATVSRSLDLMMMFLLNGKERSPTMWSNILAKCGLEFSQNPIKVPPMFAVYECKLESSN